MESWWLVWVGLLLSSGVLAEEEGAGGPKSRQKRLIWITNDGRLALPPGTLLTITPTISLPFVRYPPDGFLSNLTISLPFTINFDVLGLTDNQNPYGVLPPLLARSMGRKAGSLLADYVASLMSNRRNTRSTQFHPPPDSKTRHHFHGGERALLYIVVEDFLANFGLDGKACLLRAICEVHGHSLSHFGFLGETIKLFFTASKSPFAEVLNDYVEAERKGRENGECFPYFKDCPKSLFLPTEMNKYMVNESEHEEYIEDIDSEMDKIQRFKSNSPEITLSKGVLNNVVM